MDRVLPELSSSVPDEQRLALRILRMVNMSFARGFHQLEVLTPCPLPRSGPAILVCNHISGLDPVLIQSVSTRLIVWMMAREYYDLPGLNWIFRQLKAIPVDRRGRDLAATRRALRALENGNVLGVFPEGKIETDRRLLPFQTGVGMMALKTRMKVYPAYIDGTQRKKTMLCSYLDSQSACLIFGRSLDFAAKIRGEMGPETATNVIEKAVDNLRQRLAITPLGRKKN